MKFTKLLILLALIITVGCKDRSYYQLESAQHGVENVYFGDFGMEIEVVQDSRGRVSIKHVEEIITPNPRNNTYAVHPKFNISNKYLNGQTLEVRKDIQYTSDYDVEADSSGQNIQGRRLTVMTYEFKNDTLVVRLRIFSDEEKGNPNFVLVDRTVELEK